MPEPRATAAPSATFTFQDRYGLLGRGYTMSTTPSSCSASTRVVAVAQGVGDVGPAVVGVHHFFGVGALVPVVGVGVGVLVDFGPGRGGLELVLEQPVGEVGVGDLVAGVRRVAVRLELGLEQPVGGVLGVLGGLRRGVGPRGLVGLGGQQVPDVVGEVRRRAVVDAFHQARRGVVVVAGGVLGRAGLVDRLQPVHLVVVHRVAGDRRRRGGVVGDGLLVARGVICVGEAVAGGVGDAGGVADHLDRV